jgi:type IV secretion system protein VirB1
MSMRSISLFIAATLAHCSGAQGAEKDAAELMSRCAPKVNYETLGAIVRAESSGRMFVLSDDGPRGLPWSKRKSMIRSIYPSDAKEAAAIAATLIENGHLVGIGLTQVNSQHLSRFNVTVEELLDPCKNLAVGSQILSELFEKAKASGRYANDQQSLGAAISAFNTGNFQDGFENGYVRKVLDNVTAGVPKFTATAPPPRRAGNAPLGAVRTGLSSRVRSPKDVAQYAGLDVELK